MKNLTLAKPGFIEGFESLRDKKRAKVAIVALARKLLVICWAMLKNGTAFDADYAKRFVKC